MPPSLSPTDSFPSLEMATSTKDKGRSATPLTAGATSSVSSDLSTTSNNRRATAAAADGASNDRRYYYLSPNAVKRLPKYQYNGADLSLLYKYVLSPLAAWCVDHLTPTWLAPNAITLLGLAWMVTSYCVIWYYCPGMYETNTDLSVNADYTVPGAIFLLNGCAMLIYQTLDNMDGKQARKTGSSSPLGLLFDHGVDAMNSLLGSANWIAAMALIPGNVTDIVGSTANDHDNIQTRSLLSEMWGGDAILASLLILCPMIAFYISTWEQYYTGKLVLPPFNGPSEGLIMGASLSICSFMWGPTYWQGTTLADGAIDQIRENYDLTQFEGRVRNMDLIVFASVVALFNEVSLKVIFVVRNYGLQTARTLMPNLLLVVSALAMVHFDPTVFLRRPRVMMHLISGLFTEQTTQLMLDHMVEEEFEVRKRWCLFPPLALAIAMMAGYDFSVDALDTLLLVYTTGLWVYLAFKIRVQIYEICDVLGIWCFNITDPHPKKEQSGTAADIVGTTVPAGCAKKAN